MWLLLISEGAASYNPSPLILQTSIIEETAGKWKLSSSFVETDDTSSRILSERTEHFRLDLNDFTPRKLTDQQNCSVDVIWIYKFCTFYGKNWNKSRVIHQMAASKHFPQFRKVLSGNSWITDPQHITLGDQFQTFTLIFNFLDLVFHISPNSLSIIYSTHLI